MTKRYYFYIACVFLSVSALAILSSCINQDYDLSKDINTSIHFDGDMSAPLGSTELISVSDIFDIEEGTALKTDPAGNYYFSVSGSGQSSSFDIPSFTIDRPLIENGGFEATYERSDIIASIIPGAAGSDISAYPIPTGVVYTKSFKSVTTPVNVDQPVSALIEDVKSVDASAVLTVSFSANAGKTSVSGLSLSFPKYLKFGDISGEYRAFDRNANVLSFDNIDFVSATKTVSMQVTGIDFSKIPTGQGFLPQSHKIYIDDVVRLSAFTVSSDISSFGKYVGDIPQSVSLDISLSIPVLNISNITVKADPSINVPNQRVSVGDLPDFLKNEDIVLDLYNPSLSLIADNSSSVAMTFNADVRAVSEGGATESVHIGDDGSADASKLINIVPSNSRYYISATGEDVPDGFAGITLPSLPRLFRKPLSYIEIADIAVSPAEEYFTVKIGTSGNRVTYSYEAMAPLSFGKDLMIEYNYDIDGWNSDLSLSDENTQISMQEAFIDFNMENSTPLRLGVTAEAIDTTGTVMTDVDVEMDADISSGSVDRPSSNPVHAVIKCGEHAMKRLDGIRLRIRATGPDSGFEGQPLNENQGIRFKDMSLRLVASADIQL